MVYHLDNCRVPARPEEAKSFVTSEYTKCEPMLCTHNWLSSGGMLRYMASIWSGQFHYNFSPSTMSSRGQGFS
jgi:hypothetical protein